MTKYTLRYSSSNEYKTFSRFPRLLLMLKKSKNARFKPYQNIQSTDTDVQSSAPRRSLSAAKRKSTSEAQLDEHKNIAVSNLRHRRSRSAGVTWVDHHPGPNDPQLVRKSTIMQPSNQGREVKTIRGCPSEKDLKSPKVSRYSLTTQTQDREGELETKIYKGDVIPTSTGGTQIVFDDVEVLSQRSPLHALMRRSKSPNGKPKRRSKRSFEEVQNNVDTGMGGVGRRIAQLEAAGAAFKSGADNIESAYMGQGYSSSKKFRV